LGFRVPRFEVVVAERPRGGEATVMLDRAEVLGPEAEERGAVELGVAADVVVLLWREAVPGGGLPRLVRRVLPAEEHGIGVPVVALARQEIAPFEQQDAQACRGELPRERPTPGSTPDDHDVVVVIRHGQTLSVTRLSSGEGCDSDRCDADTMKP